MKAEIEVKLECMKQQRNPVVLSKQLFCVVENETTVKGYWKNKEGKVFIDNIEVKSFFAIEEANFQRTKKLLFAKGEEAIFFKDYNNNAIIETRKGNKTKLVNRIAWIETRKPSKQFIETLLKQNEGFTVYELEAEVFLVEVYK